MNRDNRPARGRLFYARKLQNIIATAKAVRLEEDFGTPYNTGQSMSKIMLFMDISKILEECIAEVEANKGIRRAERFAEWCLGRRVSSYWAKHREELYIDIDKIKDRFEEYDAIQ